MTITPLKEKVPFSDLVLITVMPFTYDKVVERRGRAAFDAWWAIAESDYDSDQEKVDELHSVAEAALDVMKENHGVLNPIKNYRWAFHNGFCSGALETSRGLIDRLLVEAGFPPVFSEDGELPLV